MIKLQQYINNFVEERNKCFFVIIFFVLLSHINIFQNQFLLDDYDFIVDWPLIQDWNNFSQFFVGYTPQPRQTGIYSPLKTLFHAINYHLFGLNPFGYHVISLLVHLFGIYFVYEIAFLLTKNRLITFISALLFSLHPVQVEAITSLTANVDMIGIVFLFVSLYFYARAQSQKDMFYRNRYILSIMFAVLAVYTHELAISLPLLFVWYDFCYRRELMSIKQMMKRNFPFFAIVASYVVSKHLVLESITRGSYVYDSFYLTHLIIIKAFLKYILICLFPFILTHNHVISKGIFSFDPSDFDRFEVLSQSYLDIPVLVSLIVWGFLFYYAYKSYRKNTLITFCIGFFFICLLPVSNIIPSSVYFAERYLYPGMLAFCLLATFYLNGLYHSRNGVMAVVIVSILVVFYTGRTLLRNQDWKNEVTLFESAVRANPYSALMRNDLGLNYTKSGQYEKAIKSFNEALTIRPDDPVTYFSMAETYLAMQNYKMAIDALNEAIALNPEYPDAHYNLAGIYAFLGEKEESTKYFNKAMIYYRKQGREEEAKQFADAFKDYYNSMRGTSR